MREAALFAAGGIEGRFGRLINVIEQEPDEDNDTVFILNLPNECCVAADMTLIVEKAKLPSNNSRSKRVKESAFEPPDADRLRHGKREVRETL